MYINTIGHYLPDNSITNQHFTSLNGLSDDWIYTRTGIKSRRRAGANENTQTMGIEAVKAAINNSNTSISSLDLIIGATYTPHDTIFTLAHAVQHAFNIEQAKAVTISSACSSFANALEIVQGYFAINKASKALIVVSEHNSAYSKDSDQKSGHLWGDGAAAIIVSKEPTDAYKGQIIDVLTNSHANIGKASHAVNLNPANLGLTMEFGKDIFINACKHMSSSLLEICTTNNISLPQLNYVIPHQANMRIIKHIAAELNFSEEQLVTNITEYGNTGSAGCLIALSEITSKIEPSNHVGITVFGGGYSSGSLLIKY